MIIICETVQKARQMCVTLVLGLLDFRVIRYLMFVCPSIASHLVVNKNECTVTVSA